MSLLGGVAVAPSTTDAPQSRYETPKPEPGEEVKETTGASPPESEPLPIVAHPDAPEITTDNAKELVADLCKIIERQSAEIASLRKQQSQAQKSATPCAETRDEVEDSEFYDSRSPSRDGDESPGPESHPDDVDSESTFSDDQLAARQANPLFSCGLEVRRGPSAGARRGGIRKRGGGCGAMRE